MSGPTRSAVHRIFTEALAKWPRDSLRPDCQLHDVVGKRIERELAQSGGNATEAQLKQVNALYSLLENRYQTKYRIAGRLMQPKSNPTHYTDLVKELEEAPNRSWLGRLGKKLGGLIRFKA
ncbi:hypothetical protein BR93DRAFT_971391 [Coniochaeta sp. PMI_546]|nr:hypothetical protein BR93DRAFT_971391 [Coniochaeta sp. PMI_546]